MKKDIGKYILISFLVVILEWICISCFPILFNGLGKDMAIMAGIGFFLAFEIAFCTCIIISKEDR